MQMVRKQLRVVVTIVATGIAGAALVVATPADAATSYMLSGAVVDSAGASASQATITVTAWPNSATLDPLAVGAKVPTVQVQVATTDTTGSYQINPDLTALPASYKEDDGTVNLQVDADDGAGASQDFYISAAVPGSTASTFDKDSVGGNTEQISFNLKNSTVSDGSNNGFAATAQDPSTSQAVAATATNDPNATPDDNVPNGRCSGNFYVSANYQNRDEKFLNLYTSGSAVVTEKVGSSHKLGIGVEVTGGGWSVGGNASVDNSKTRSGVVPYSQNETLRNEVNMSHYKERCTKIGSGAVYYKHKVATTSMAYLQTAMVRIHNRVWASCHTYPPSYQGAKYGIASGSNQTFSGGLDAPPISLSSQASFSQQTSVEWTIPYGGEQLCGSTSSGFGGSPFVGAQATNTGGCGSPGMTDPASIDGDDVTPSSQNDAVPNC